jgi:hypothetical protein
MGEDGQVEGRVDDASTTTRGRRRLVGRAVAVFACLAVGIAACSSQTDTSSDATTTTANKPAGAKAGFEFAAAPKGPIGPDSTPEQKCYAVKAFRYLVAMPDSGKFFKDKLAGKPAEADERLQTLRRQLEAAIPDVAPDLATLADDAHRRLHEDKPSSGLAMLGSPPDKHLISYLTANCGTKPTPA